MKTNITKALEMREGIQAKHGDKCVVLFRTAGEYELYSNDAIALYKAEGETFKNADDVRFEYVKYKQDKIEAITEMARIDFRQLDQVLRKLIRANHRVCICGAPIDFAR